MIEIWMFCGYEPRMGYSVKSHCRNGDPRTGVNEAWFVLESAAREYAARMNSAEENRSRTSDF